MEAYEREVKHMASYSFPKTANSTTYTLLGGNSFYPTRRNGGVLGIVLHVTAGLQDLDLVGVDGSAEGTARWAIGREVSWHVGVDSDSIRPTLPAYCTAWHAKGYNSRTVGIEISNLDARWDNKPAEWVTRTLRNAAKAAAAYVDEFNLPLVLATKAQVDSATAANRKFGFTYHSILDPGMRVDPGKTFPWTRFIEMVKEELGKSPQTVPTPASVFYCYRGDTGAAVVRVQKIVGVTADGSFGPGTEAAVVKWQAAHKILADGMWGPVTEATYQLTLKATAPKPTPAPAPAPAPSPAPAVNPVKGKFPLSSGYFGRDNGKPISHSGVRGNDATYVKMIQRKVGATVDGRFGPGTEMKVIAWQKKNIKYIADRLANGKVGPNTWAAMLKV
jgi:peptidoglycan hydrolase-like protein with peptidoglycan-binding domain